MIQTLREVRRSPNDRRPQPRHILRVPIARTRKRIAADPREDRLLDDRDPPGGAPRRVCCATDAFVLRRHRACRLVVLFPSLSRSRPASRATSVGCALIAAPRAPPSLVSPSLTVSKRYLPWLFRLHRVSGPSSL